MKLVIRLGDGVTPHQKTHIHISKLIEITDIMLYMNAPFQCFTKRFGLSNITSPWLFYTVLVSQLVDKIDSSDEGDEMAAVFADDRCH